MPDCTAASTFASPMPRVLWKWKVRCRSRPPPKRSAQRSTSSSGTSPSIGQPKQVESDTFTGTCPATRSTTAFRPAKLCARGMRRLARLCVSDRDITRFSSSARDSSARSAPRTFGTSTVYSTPGTRRMRPITSSASRSIGIALADVKDVTSILA